MSLDRIEKFDIEVIHSRLTSETLRKEIVSLCNRAYEKDMQTLLETFLDATHVLGYYNDLFVCHALWVTRDLQVGTNPILRTAYVEAVATEAEYRHRGFASSVMKYLVMKFKIMSWLRSRLLALNIMNGLDGNVGVVHYSFEQKKATCCLLSTMKRL